MSQTLKGDHMQDNPKKSSSLQILKLGVLALALISAAACTKKNVQPDGSASVDSSAADSALADKDISYDSMGSDSGSIAGLNTVYFEFDQARLSNETKETLKANADWIRNNPDVSVQIEGHTDSRGSTEYNLSLGERRAKAVRQYLVSLGVDSKRLPIISYGEEKPLMPGDNEASWGKNRRANFVPLR
jgi:peptidoglycan-associated lipoprotein